MAIASDINPLFPADNPWSYSVSQDGTQVVTERKSGELDSVLAWATSFNIGTVYRLVRSADCPFTGYYLATGAQVEVSVAGIASATRTYTVPRGDVAALSSSNPSDLGRTETIDFATIEKPIIDAKFWRDAYPATCEGAGGAVEALKRVQLYIDAPSQADADSARANFANAAAEDKMAKYLLAGTEAYLYPAPTASVSYESRSRPAGFGNAVGKVFSAPDTPNVGVPAGFNWLCNGDRLEWSRGTGIFSRTQSWLGADSWDADLYGNVN